MGGNLSTELTNFFSYQNSAMLMVNFVQGQINRENSIAIVWYVYEDILIF